MIQHISSNLKHTQTHGSDELLSLFVSLSLNSIVLMLYFDFIYFGSPRGDPLSWRTVLHGAVGLTIRELCSTLWKDMFAQHPWFKWSMNLCQPLRTEKHFKPVLNSLFHWMFFYIGYTKTVQAFKQGIYKIVWQSKQFFEASFPMSHLHPIANGTNCNHIAYKNHLTSYITSLAYIL